MKTAALTLALAAASFAAVAQSQPATPAVATAASAAPADAYTTMMLATIAEQDQAAPAALPANIAKLERAASARPTDWLPRYYQARAYFKTGMTVAGQIDKDLAFDHAQTALEQAQKLAGANQAELLVLQAMIYQGRIMVSPMERGMEYTGRVEEALQAARALEPQNPRVALVQGDNLYFRPAMFGGGADKAKPFYVLAKTLFITYKPATALSPNWGEKKVDAQLGAIAALASAK
jgi:hypothetical protein